MTRTIIIAGILSVSALLISPNLLMTAQTGWETAQGLLVGFIGLVFAVMFAGLWATHLDDRARRLGRRRPF